MSGAERSRTLAARDAEARRRACSEFERPVVLEAGAGTGKTTALVTRVLAWGLTPRQCWSCDDKRKSTSGLCSRIETNR